VKPLCVIPARRGSKRLPEKNVAQLGGRPLLAWTVDAALESELFDHVYVSTEDPGYAALARELGATPHARPIELAGDLVSATDVCLDVLDAHDGHDAVVCLQPSSPLRTADDVRGAWERFVDSGADYLVSVTPIDPHYYHWAVEQDGEWWRMVFGDRYLVERLLLPPIYRPNGAIKIGRTGPLRARRDFFGPRLATYELPHERSVHVAEPFDLRLAESLLAAAADPSPS
jgi:CMP-N,N'-diacetyllegionaminic acid synthase